MKVKQKAAAALLAGIAASLGFFAVPRGLHASPAGADDAKPAVTLPKLEFTDTKLENGLRVILVPDHSAPVYSIDVCYNSAAATSAPAAPASRTCSNT
jgi:hypothetical protein